MTTPLRNILTARGMISGLRDAIYQQISSSSLHDLTFLNDPHLVETSILNTSLLILATSTLFMLTVTTTIHSSFLQKNAAPVSGSLRGSSLVMQHAFFRI